MSDVNVETGADVVERALGFVAEFHGDGRAALNCMHAEALAAEVHRLRRALNNCYMMAKREQARILNHGMRDTHVITLERWQHVLRFCEEAGCTSSVLRASVPTDITDG